MKNLVTYLVVVLLLASCKNTVRHGYLFDLSDHQLVQEGITSKERVIKIMGSPTLISNLDEDETWIYYSEDVNYILFFLPEIQERTIIALKFDQSETVKNIDKIDLSHEDKKLKFASHFTEVESNKIGFFKSLYSNVGQVKAAQ